MMTTLELLFRDIPGALYEPIYYTALAAVILVFWPKRIRDVRAFCFLGAVFIMVLWRLLIQIISSRYSLLLIYPAIFGALFSCKTVAEVLYDRIPGIRRYGSSRGIAYFFLGLLLLASLLRFCMINPYWETLQKAARTVREDVQNNEALIWSNSINDVPRFRFYSKLPVLPLGIELKQQIAVLDEAV